MTKITILGIDPALRNFGMALAEVDVATKKITPIDLLLVKTEATKGKQVRVSSDNLRAAQELNAALERFAARASLAAAEIPSGAKSAKAAYGLGLAVGVVGACKLPLIEVNPIETKKAATGSKTASKAEIMAWAFERWPKLNWIRHGGRETLDNEHCADALAIIVAATLTRQFDQAVALMLAANRGVRAA